MYFTELNVSSNDFVSHTYQWVFWYYFRSRLSLKISKQTRRFGWFQLLIFLPSQYLTYGPYFFFPQLAETVHDSWNRAQVDLCRSNRWALVTSARKSTEGKEAASCEPRRWPQSVLQNRFNVSCAPHCHNQWKQPLLVVEKKKKSSEVFQKRMAWHRKNQTKFKRRFLKTVYADAGCPT